MGSVMKIEWDDSNARHVVTIRPKLSVVESADELAARATQELAQAGGSARKVSRAEVMEAILEQALKDPKFKLKLPR